MVNSSVWKCLFHDMFQNSFLKLQKKAQYIYKKISSEIRKQGLYMYKVQYLVQWTDDVLTIQVSNDNYVKTKRNSAWI